jgi:hypothetical protein
MFFELCEANQLLFALLYSFWRLVETWDFSLNSHPYQASQKTVML